MKKLLNIPKFIFKNGRRFLLLLYMPIYMFCFTTLERANDRDFILISSKFDEMIPFCEFFIIPYFLWFIYMAYGITYIIFREKGMEFYLLASTLSFGMTLFIIISFFWPNHIAIRPTDFPRENIFTDLVRYLYTIDTPTNVFPSIHVFNSIEVHLALCRTDHYRRHKPLIYISALFTTLIVLSTMFLKQHTVIDVIAGIVLVIVLYPFVYGRWDKYVRRFWNFFDPKYAE